MSGATIACIAVGAVVLLLIWARLFTTWMVKRHPQRPSPEREAMEAEGVLLDSGNRAVTLHYENFRTSGLYVALGKRAGERQLVLTNRSFAILGHHSEHVPRTELHRYTVENTADELILRTDNPVNGSGHVEVHVKLTNAPEWGRALHDAGAK